MDLKDSTATWKNVMVAGNKTWTTLPGLSPGKRYFVMVQAMTKAGYGKPSEPIIIITPEPPNSADERQPSQNMKPDQSLGKSPNIMQFKFLIKYTWASFYTILLRKSSPRRNYKYKYGFSVNLQ